MHGIILHSLGAQLHHTWPLFLCGTSWHPTHLVWPHTPHIHMVFLFIPLSLKNIGPFQDDKYMKPFYSLTTVWTFSSWQMCGQFWSDGLVCSFRLTWQGIDPFSHITFFIEFGPIQVDGYVEWILLDWPLVGAFQVDTHMDSWLIYFRSTAVWTL